MEKKSVNQLANEKSQRILEGVAAWCAFYRDNPQRFVADYLNITLKTFQKFLIYAMMHNTHFMFWAARSIGKHSSNFIFQSPISRYYCKTKRS